MPIDTSRPFYPANVGVLTVSDTRTLEATDGSRRAGRRAADRAPATSGRGAGDRHATTATQIGAALARRGSPTPAVDVVIIVTGGTGVTPRDVTPEALAPLVTKPIPGFGELFRYLSLRRDRHVDDPEPRRGRAVRPDLRVPAARLDRRRCAWAWTRS
jgi:molybdenum cofactor biosynthesis protein B